MAKKEQQEEKLYRVKTKEGTHLASSKKTEGAKRANLLDDDSNEFSGNAELIEVDVEELIKKYSSESSQSTSNEVYDYQEVYQYTPMETETQSKSTLEEVSDVLDSLTQLIEVATPLIIHFAEEDLPRIKRWYREKAKPNIIKAKNKAVTRTFLNSLEIMICNID